MSAGKTNVSEPSRSCRKRRDAIETRLLLLAWDKSGGRPANCPDGGRHKDGVSPAQALVRNMGTYRPDVKGDPRSGGPTRGRVPMRGEGTDGLVVARKPGNAGGAKGPDTSAPGTGQPATGGASA